jgi:hypothetical protein
MIVRSRPFAGLSPTCGGIVALVALPSETGWDNRRHAIAEADRADVRKPVENNTDAAKAHERALGFILDELRGPPPDESPA